MTLMMGVMRVVTWKRKTNWEWTRNCEGGNCQGCRQVEPVSELEESLEERLSECCCQIELLTAVMNLMYSPQNPHLMTCTVEPVISKVNEDRSEDPSPRRVPGEVKQSVVCVNPGIGGETSRLAEKSDHSHEESTRYACDAVGNIVPLSPAQPVDESFNDDQGHHVRHCLLDIVRHLGGLGK